MISKNSDMRAAARWGVGAAIVVTIGSAIANAYAATVDVADAAGGWGELGTEGGLNAALNGALAVSSEAIGFLALGFIVAAAATKRWVNFAAAGAVFIVCLLINAQNTHSFFDRQAHQAALERVRNSEPWLQADQRKAAAEREIGLTRETVSPKALREKLARLTGDREAALQEGRYFEARKLREEIKQAGDEFAAAVSLAERATKAQADLDAAVAMIGDLEANAKPPEGTERRTWVLITGLELIKALAMAAFSVGDAPRPAPADKASAPAPTPTAPTKPRLARAKQQLSIEEKRARQRAYTAKWRAGKATATA